MNPNMYDDYMDGMEGLNGFHDDNADLNSIFNSNAYQYPTASNPGDNLAFGSGFTPNDMNMDGTVMGATYPQDNMFQAPPSQPQYEPQTSGFPFPQQQVDPAIIMKPESTDGPQGSEDSQSRANSQEQAGSNGYSQTAEPSYSKSPKDSIFIPKVKRTRQSKKKPLSKEQEIAKREEFLERNRVAASKCRKRKQEHTGHMQEDAQILSHLNQHLQEELATLRQEMNHLSQIVILHKDCKAAQLDTRIAQFIPASDIASNYASAGVAMSRPGSSNSTSGLPSGLQPAYNEDGSINLLSPYVTNEMLRAERRKQDAKSNAYVKERAESALEMSRQNSNESRMFGTSPTDSAGSGYTSAITTPENTIKDASSPKVISDCSARRGLLCRTLENPRSPTQQQGFPVDPALQYEGLQGLQNPADYLDQQHQV